MTDQLKSMREVVAAHKAKGMAMKIEVVPVNRRHMDGIEELWGVAVNGRVEVTFPTKPLADAFAVEIVRGEA